jgi:outer membrane protein assembly factor BamA
VRGWAVRTLGPGTYTSPNSEDFVSQSGNIELTANMEYRSKLFWKFEGAAFADAGNIWNIKDYDFQPEGTFHLDEFYKQIAMAYGLGLRCDFTYFLIRLDVGMKAYDPALPDGERWRYHDITWSDDFAFHFAIGYPF